MAIKRKAIDGIVYLCAVNRDAQYATLLHIMLLSHIRILRCDKVRIKKS